MHGRLGYVKYIYEIYLRVSSLKSDNLVMDVNLINVMEYNVEKDNSGSLLLHNKVFFCIDFMKRVSK